MDQGSQQNNYANAYTANPAQQTQQVMPLPRIPLPCALRATFHFLFFSAEGRGGFSSGLIFFGCLPKLTNAIWNHVVVWVHLLAVLIHVVPVIYVRCRLGTTTHHNPRLSLLRPHLCREDREHTFTRSQDRRRRCPLHREDRQDGIKAKRGSRQAMASRHIRYFFWILFCPWSELGMRPSCKGHLRATECGNVSNGYVFHVVFATFTPYLQI